MDKLSYEMNRITEQVYKQVKKQDIIKAIKVLQDLDLSYDDVLDKVLQYFGEDMPKDEIEELVKENYQLIL